MVAKREIATTDAATTKRRRRIPHLGEFLSFTQSHFEASATMAGRQVNPDDRGFILSKDECE
jgi:hypothetical protein